MLRNSHLCKRLYLKKEKFNDCLFASCCIRDVWSALSGKMFAPNMAIYCGDACVSRLARDSFIKHTESRALLTAADAVRCSRIAAALSWRRPFSQYYMMLDTGEYGNSGNAAAFFRPTHALCIWSCSTNRTRLIWSVRYWCHFTNGNTSALESLVVPA